VSALQQKGSTDVAFRVAIKNGKVAFSARVVKTEGGRGLTGKREVEGWEVRFRAGGPGAECGRRAGLLSWF
jgi:hypothetical protein